MPNFAAPGFSRGFASGQQAARDKREQRLEQQRIREAKKAQAQKQLQEALTKSEDSAQEHFDQATDQIMELAKSGAAEEDIAQFSDFALLGPRQHAKFLVQLRLDARRAGATDEQLSLLPDPEQYLTRHIQTVQNSAEIGAMVAAQDIGQDQFREGDEFVTRRTTRGVADFSPAGVVARSPISPVQRVEQGGPGSFSGDARTGSQRGEAAAASIEQLEDSQRRILDLTATGSALRESPRAAGVTGFLNEWVGGAVGQVSPALASGISEMMTGLDPERASQLRSDFRILIAQNLTNITGEESGRYTEQERRIAEQTIRTLPPNATADQVLGAFGTLLRVELASEARELARQDKPQRFSLVAEGDGEDTFDMGGIKVSKKAAIDADNFLVEAGITSEQVRDSVIRYLTAIQSQGVVPIRGDQ